MGRSKKKKMGLKEKSGRIDGPRGTENGKICLSSIPECDHLNYK